MQDVSTSTCLSCVEIATEELELGVSVSEWLLLSSSILLANGALTGVPGIVAGFTGISGSGFVGIAGYSDVLQIPWLFLEGLPAPVVIIMLVTSLLISL